jgi:rubrerythrin
MTEIAPVRTNDALTHPQPDQSPTCISADADRLVRALEAHASAEAHDLADCQDLAQRSDDPYVRLLFDMIIDDEQRHQALLQSMVGHLRDGPPPGDGLSVPADLSDATATPLPGVELAAALRDLIRNEHEAARHLRHVGRQDAAVYEGLYAVLLDSIARDSEKHAALLRYLLTRLERRPT